MQKRLEKTLLRWRKGRKMTVKRPGRRQTKRRKKRERVEEAVGFFFLD